MTTTNDLRASLIKDACYLAARGIHAIREQDEFALLHLDDQQGERFRALCLAVREGRIGVGHLPDEIATIIRG